MPSGVAVASSRRRSVPGAVGKHRCWHVTPSFPRRREPSGVAVGPASAATRSKQSRRPGEGRGPSTSLGVNRGTWVPAFAGMTSWRASLLGSWSRRSREGGNPVALPSGPASAATRSKQRRRAGEGRGPSTSLGVNRGHWVPAFAGMTRLPSIAARLVVASFLRRRERRGVAVSPASAATRSKQRRRAGEGRGPSTSLGVNRGHWVPAFAGMTRLASIARL